MTQHGAAATARDRHRDAFLELSERVAPQLLGSQQRQWLEVLDPEAGNLAAALEWAADTDAERALRLCVALTRWWRLRGLLRAGERSFHRALAAADPGPSPRRAAALFGRSYLSIYAGRIEEGHAGAQEAVDTAEQLGDPSLLSLALSGLGFSLTFRDPVGSRPTSVRARQHARASGNVWALVFSTVNLANSHFLCAEFEAVEQLLGEIWPLSEELGYPDATAWYWIGIALRPLFAADTQRFCELAGRSLAASQTIGEPMCEAFAQALLALLELAQGHAEAAIERLEPCRERAIAAGAGLALHWIDVHLAPAQAAVGELPAARARLERVVASGADFGWTLGWATVHLADVLRISGEMSAADARAREALHIAERMGAPALVTSAQELLGRVAGARGDWWQAEGLLNDALATRLEHQLWLYLPQTLDGLAEAAGGLSHYELAASLLGAAQRARTDFALARWTPDAARLMHLESVVREELGEDGFNRAHERGATWSPTDMATLAAVDSV